MLPSQLTRCLGPERGRGGTGGFLPRVRARPAGPRPRRPARMLSPPAGQGKTTAPGCQVSVSIYFKNTQNINFLQQSDNLTYTLSHTYLVFFASLCKR